MKKKDEGVDKFNKNYFNIGKKINEETICCCFFLIVTFQDEISVLKKKE